MNADSFARNLSGVILLVLLIALPLAFLASIALLRLYRRAVIRGMRKHMNIEQEEPLIQETSALSQEPVNTVLNIMVHDSSADKMTKPAANGLYSDLLQAPWRAAAIYVVAGVCYALVLTIVFLSATGNNFHLLSFLMLFWYYAWPVVVTICLVAAGTWRTRFVIALIYFLSLLPFLALTLFTNSSVGWGQIVVLWLLTNFIALVVLLAFLNRRIRAVGPLVLTFMIIAVTGLVILPIVVGIDSRLLRPIIILGRLFGLQGDSVFTVLFPIGFILFGGLGWLVLQWIGSWYKQKRISEQSITIDAIWLLFGVFQSIGLIFEGERWFIASLMAFVVYKIVSWAGFTYFGRKAYTSQKSPNLLLLRVFSLGSRSERLFDILGMHWRYLGSIRLIAGPDLATATMEPHEFLDFLSGKLARRFIDSAQTLDLRISEMDNLPDRDGQFRVNDFFCYDDVWKMVLSRLISTSDVVLMDLRSFSSQNAGCIFEINELINTVTLERMIFIIDETTDEIFLRQVLQQAWDGMRSTSPNRFGTSGLLHLFCLKGLGNHDVGHFLQVLSRAVTA
jgi:hypothetical protein